ncbi:MAG: hypothetical protein ACD_5C00160G0002, partial [uncultured bacterium]
GGGAGTISAAAPNCSTVSSNFSYNITPAGDVLSNCASATCDQTGCRYTAAGGSSC